MSKRPLTPLSFEDYKPLREKTAFADFETDGLGGSFIAGGIVGMSSDYVQIFSSIEEFIDIIFLRENGDYVESVYDVVYFHNLEYDGRYILLKLIELGIQFEIINRVNRLLIIRVGQFMIVDSYALLTDSLRNLSNVFAPQYAKKTIDFDNVTFDINNPDHITYLSVDCLALKYVIIGARKLIHETFGINAKYTTFKTALRAFQTTMNEPIFRLSKEKDDFVRKCYSGGFVGLQKVDVFENITDYDFNAMYPSVMRDYPYPCGQSFFTNEYEGVGFYRCFVDAKKAKFLFLSSWENDKKTTRATGKFECYMTDVEVKLARKIGYKVSIVQGLCFTETKFLFKDFVDKCEELRLKHGKDAVGVITKFIQNNLYGGFGTKPDREQFYFSNEFIEDKQPFVDPTTGEFFGLYIDKIELDEPYMLPHFAAYTTALARCKLVNAIMLAGHDNVIYWDTDSIFCNEEGAKKLNVLVGNRYGQLKIEQEIKRILTVAPKMYFLDKKRAKGFPKGVINQLEELLTMVNDVNDERISVSFNSLNSCRAILKYHRSFGKIMTRSVKVLPKEIKEKAIIS